MKITGIICEYNPFHNGHIHHIKKTKELTNCDILVCVMSPNFVQRGEPAIIDKWERAKIAVENGVDIVFELPFIYATQSASYFAKGAIDCLKLANVDSIVFGSESNNLEILKNISQMDTAMDDSFEKEGLSTAKIYEKLYGNWNANDILGLNYLKEIQNTKIVPYTIQRTNYYHDEKLTSTISSATSIRKAVDEHSNYSDTTPMKSLSSTFHIRNYYSLIRILLLTMKKEELHTLFLMDEGIENLFIKNAKKYDTYEDFINASVSKRYTKSRIQRTLIHLMNHTTKEEVNHLPPIQYLRVLAYNDKGKILLRSLKEEILIVSKISQMPEVYKNMEIKASHVYAYPLEETKKNEFIKKELQAPIYVK